MTALPDVLARCLVGSINARDQEAYVRQTVSVAHPDFRDELARAAWERYRIMV